jgi:GDP-L-fucose synthase
LIVAEVGYKSQLVFDKTKPDGTPIKLIDMSKLNKLGWRSSISLEDRIKKILLEVNHQVKK